MRHCLFLGDAHILPEDRDFQARLSSFLLSLDGKFDHIFILGDLFEFWFGFEGYPFQREYGLVLDALRRLVSQGMQLVYFEGNHDFNMGPVFSDELQADIYPDWHRFEIDGRRWYVTHGDLVEASYLRYGLYRRLLKNGLTYGFLDLLGPRIVLKIAKKLGAMSYQVYHTPRAYAPEKYQSYVMERFAEGYDVVIMGHTHKSEIVERKVGERTCLYINCGELRNGETYITYHPESGFEIHSGLEPLS